MNSVDGTERRAERLTYRQAPVIKGWRKYIQFFEDSTGELS
jgi:hypothetical protein